MDAFYGQTILEEAYDENYEPTEDEILDYCKVLGLDPDAEKDLMYIAKEGTKAPLPKDWKPVEDVKTGGIYYFNFKTNESTWDHPCDEFYRKLLQEERKKRAKDSGSKKGSKKSAKVKMAAGSESNSVPNPLNPVLGGGRGSLAPLGPIRGLPPLRAPPQKPGVLAPVRPPPGVAPVMGPPPLGLSLTSTPSPLTSTPSPLTQYPHVSGAPTTLNPLQRGVAEGGRREQVSGRGDEQEGQGWRFEGVSRGRGGRGEGGIGEGMGGLKGMRGNERSDLLGTVELGDNLNISTQFEEEEDESSSAISGRFQTKLGENLINSKDLGLKSDEEICSSDEDNVTEELNRMLHSDGEESAADEEGEMERPVARLGLQKQHTGTLVGHSPTSPTGIPFSPVLSPPIPASLSPLPVTLQGVPGKPNPLAVTTANDRLTPTTHRNTEPAITTANSRVLPITSPSITAPSGLTVGATTIQDPKHTSLPAKDTLKPKTNVTSSVQPATTILASAGSGGFSVAEIKSGGQGQVGVASREETVDSPSISLEKIKATHKNAKELERLRLEHEKAVEELKKDLLADLEQEKEAVRSEGREAVERVRREVEEGRAEEERKLRDRKLKNLSELKKMLKDEEEEEEARLVEGKEDTLRRLKQKITSDKEQEEGKLREAAEKSRHDLVEKLEQEKREKEARLHSEASQELNKFREEAERRAEEEREKVRKELERQLQVFREEQEEKLNKEKAEIEGSCREQLETIQREEQLKVQAELERKQSSEEEREKAVQTHKKAINALEEEFATALEAKRSELQEQHHTILENIKKELEATLVSVKAEEERKIEMERQRLRNEYDTMTAKMKEEQEGKVEQLKMELAAAEEQHKKQMQSQSEKLASLESDYNKRQSELEQLQKDLEHQYQHIEEEKKKITEEQVELKAMIEKERETLVSLQTSHSSLEEELEQLREQCSQEKMRLQELQQVTGRRERGGERRKGRKGGYRQDTDDPLLFLLTEPQSRDTRMPGHFSSLSAAHKQLLATDTETRKKSGNERVKIQMSEERERVKAQSPDLKSEEDWSETSGTVSSMQLEELSLPMASRRAREGEGRRDRREKTSGGRKEKEKQKRSKKRVSTQTPRLVVGDGVGPTNSVQPKLLQGERTLRDLEEKLYSSRQLLLSKEQELRELQSLLTGGQSGGRESPPAVQTGSRLQLKEDSTWKDGRISADDISKREWSFRTPKYGGSEVHKTHRVCRTDEESGPRTRRISSRTHQTPRRASSSTSISRQSRGGRGNTSRGHLGGGVVERTPLTADRVVRESQMRLEASETSSDVDSSESSTTMGNPSAGDHVSTIEDQMEGQPREMEGQPREMEGQQREMEGEGQQREMEGEGQQREMEGEGQQREIAKSLKNINLQLSQLMSRISQGLPPRSLPSMSPTDKTRAHYTHSAVEPHLYPSSQTATRWADPVLYPTSPNYHKQKRRHFTSPRHVRTVPSLPNAYRPGVSGDYHMTSTSPTYLYRSGEDTIQQQTDWSREFHHQFPGGPLPSESAPFVRPPSAPLLPYTVPHTQLVMDSDKNIHLVHM